MNYEIKVEGPSRSFPEGDAFRAGSRPSSPVLIHLGDCSGAEVTHDPARTAVLVELDRECLGVHTGEQAGEEGSNILGFARYRNGTAEPSNLIELVHQPASLKSAIEAATAVFTEAGFEVALCRDLAGRIIDRLEVPKLNDALRFLDEGLATAKDMDLTCRLGLGYAEGPIERVERGGLEQHYLRSRALFEVYGTPAYAPARRSVVAHQRSKKT